MIYSSKANISVFRFVEGATAKQKEEALGKIINSFVHASKNLDFSSDKNLFFVSNGRLQVRYNNGGSQSMKISGTDIQEKLGLKTDDVLKQQMFRQQLGQSRTK